MSIEAKQEGWLVHISATICDESRVPTFAAIELADVYSLIQQLMVIHEAQEARRVKEHQEALVRWCDSYKPNLQNAVIDTGFPMGLKSLQEKVTDAKPGSIVPLTGAEFKALAG